MKFQKDTLIRFLLAILAFMAVDAVLWTLGFLATRSLYVDARYYTIWTRDVLTLIEGGHGSIQSLIGIEILTGLVGALYVGGYQWLGRKLPGMALQRGLTYGTLMFVCGGLYQLLGVAMVIDLPAPIITSWIVLSGAVLVLQGVTTAYIVKK